MGTEEWKTEPEKDKGNASACFLWKLTSCQGFFDLCCHGGRTQCLVLPETHIKYIETLALQSKNSSCIIGKQAKVLPWHHNLCPALCTSEKMCYNIPKKDWCEEVGCTSLQSDWSLRFSEERTHTQRVKQQTACDSVAKNLTSTSKW